MPTKWKPGKSRRDFAPSWQARSSCAPCLHKKGPDPGWSSSARGRWRRSSRQCRRDRSWSPARRPMLQRVPRWSSERGARMPVSCHPPVSICCFLECVDVCLAGADAHRAFERHDENFAIADLAGPRGYCQHFHDLVKLLARDCNLEPQLGKEVHFVFGATIYFRMPFLPPVPFDFPHSHSVDADTRERFAHLIKLEWLNDSDDEFHGLSAPGERRPAKGADGNEKPGPTPGRRVNFTG